MALFVGNIEQIAQFLESHFQSTNEIEDFIHSLRLWKKIFKFLGITFIEDKEEYEKRMEEFNINVQKFYEHGSRTFLSSPGSMDGNQETFYTHTLRYYIPDIVSETFKKHALGVGIFTMQGFERRNKESKNCLRRFTNGKGNMLVQNMKRLCDVFEHDVNAM